MWREVLLTITCTCISYTLQQGHPPGVPPPQKVHPDGHGPPGDVSGHHGHGGFGTGAHDAQHIKEHLKEVVDKPKEEMTDEELEFHYFKLHDYDDNNKLDGTEITKAITHFHADSHESDSHVSEVISEEVDVIKEIQEEEDEAAHDAQQQAKVFSDEEIVNIVDMVLKEDDLNNDGYIEYVEFVTAQRKARGHDANP